MKKNSMFWSMIGLSVTFHGLVLFGVAGSGFHDSPPSSEKRFISTIRIIQTETAPQKNAPVKPREETPVEKIIEAPLEPVPVQETEHSEETQEYEALQDSADAAGNNEESNHDEGDVVNNGEAREGGAIDDETITDREYEELLAYIKDFINKNLVYPPMARRRNIQGVVGVYFEIGESGEIVSVLVNHSSGSSMLDNAAVSLIKKIFPLKNITVRKRTALNVNIDYKLTE
ncbi:MAG: energy transducer TonB [Treponema sp.]|jgi:protein TonB|nr:energy transducer TonB [Treponema sp.]